jgi:hypothetical protein
MSVLPSGLPLRSFLQDMRRAVYSMACETARSLSSGYWWWYCLGACLAIYLLVAAVVPTDFVGDTSDYFSLAIQYCRPPFSAAFNPMRAPGYPIFLCIASRQLQDIWLVYAVQIGIFMTALLIMCRTTAAGTWTCVAILAAAIPYYAYLQKLFYPDGLAASLILLFLAAVSSRRYIWAAILAAALVAIKLVFAIAFVVLAFVFVWNRLDRRKAVVVYGLIGLVVATPALAVAELIAFRDLALMVTFVRPTYAGRPQAELLPTSDFVVSCGGMNHAIAVSQLDFSLVRAIAQTSPSGLLSAQKVADLGCTPADVHAAKLEAILATWRHVPEEHSLRMVEFFVNAVIGRPLFYHASYMLIHKSDISEKAGLSGLYSEDEIETLSRLSASGVKIDFHRQDFLNRAGRWFYDRGEDGVRAIALLLLFAALVMLQWRRALYLIVKDPIVVPCVAFLLCYSLALALSAAVLSDRYTFANLLVLCFVAARMSALAWSSATASSTLTVAKPAT